MSKGVQTRNGVFMHKHIPYLHCFEEDGMIETEAGVYTRGYRILPPEGDVKGNYSSKVTRMLMEKMLVRLAASFSFEFTIRNCYIDKEEYLSKIMLDEREDAYRHLRSLYNRLLQENCDIGHNNFTREVYLTVSTEADTPDEALQCFEESDEWMGDLFEAMYGLRMEPMELPDRLELLYHMYHPEPEAAAFGSKVDYDGNGFSIRSMQRMNMDTKDVIAPDRYECKARDYMKVGNYFVRTFFINSVPESVPDSMLLDFSSVSPNSILSVHYQGIDQELGFQVAARLVRENTEVKRIPIRDTITDRKEHRMQRRERSILDSEEQYFYRSALEKFKQAKAKKQPAILASFVIALYAESLEELDRDSSLLYLSASKYVCQIRCLDLQQNEGFQSVLPLNNLKIHAGRMFSAGQLAVMQPFRLQDIFEKVRTFYGLNAINYNFVMMDRSNFPTAMIAGVPHTGKTSAVKREAANTLMCTRDDVVILAKNMGEYRTFAENMKGQMVGEFYPDIFDKDINYNLNGEKRVLQKLFLEAFLTARAGFHRQRLLPEVLQASYGQAEREAEVLCGFASWNEALLYAKDHPEEMQLFVKAVEQYRFDRDCLGKNKRLTVLGFERADELLVKLDYLWNYAVQRKKENRTVWIYVDGADDLLYSTAASDYLISILERAEILKIPVTLVIQDAVHIVTNQWAAIEFDYLLHKIRYFKLLSLGPVERKKFVERLNISQQLVPYFVERGPGEGLLLTPSANIAFNDHFESRDNEFYQLFY